MLQCEDELTNILQSSNLDEINQKLDALAEAYDLEKEIFPIFPKVISKMKINEPVVLAFVQRFPATQATQKIYQQALFSVLKVEDVRRVTFDASPELIVALCNAGALKQPFESSGQPDIKFFNAMLEYCKKIENPTKINAVIDALLAGDNATVVISERQWAHFLSVIVSNPLLSANFTAENQEAILKNLFEKMLRRADKFPKAADFSKMKDLIKLQSTKTRIFCECLIKHDSPLLNESKDRFLMEVFAMYATSTFKSNEDAKACIHAIARYFLKSDNNITEICNFIIAVNSDKVDDAGEILKTSGVDNIWLSANFLAKNMLHMAVNNDWEKMVSFLTTECKADKNQSDDSNKLPLQYVKLNETYKRGTDPKIVRDLLLVADTTKEDWQIKRLAQTAIKFLNNPKDPVSKEDRENIQLFINKELYEKIATTGIVKGISALGIHPSDTEKQPAAKKEEEIKEPTQGQTFKH